jgi:arsenate reductase-like glutaredoxin family protein
MFKKTLSYTNYNGVPVTETLYFNYTKPELLRLHQKYDTQDLSEKFQEIANTRDPNQMLPLIEDIIIGSYGEKSSDGKAFMKSSEIASKFENSIAYAELFETLLTNENELIAFVNGLTAGLDTKKDNDPVKQLQVESQQMSTTELLERIKSDPILAERLLSQEGDQNGSTIENN